MSVTSLDFQNQYTTDGVSFVYPFTWTTINQNEVTVYLNNVAQVLGTDFTVQLNPVGIGGTISFLAVPPTGQALLIQRVDDFLQPNNFGNNQALPPQTLVQMFDKLTIMCQQLLQQSTLSLALSLPAAAAGVDATLPFPIVAGSLIGWDAAATGTAYVDPVSAGYVLTDNGVGNLPSFQAPTGGGGGGGGSVNTNPASIPTFTGELAIYNGTLGTVIAGAGANGAAGTVLTSTGVASAPTWSSASGSPLRAASISVAGRQFPTSGGVEGVYNHFGNWTQTGNINSSGPVKVFHNGAAFAFVNGFTFSSSTNDKATGGAGAFGAGVTAGQGQGYGPAQNVNTYAANTAGGGGGACGGFGGSGGSSSATAYNFGGQIYDFLQSLSGTGGSGGNATATVSSNGNGGNGGGGFYLESTGNVVFSTVANVPSINMNGTAGSAPVPAAQGAGGGGSGGVVVIRCAGTVTGGNGTNTISCNGGAGGASSTGGGGGGGGGGIIDIQSASAISATGFSVTGGAAGAGSATKAAQAGSAGVTSVVASTPVFSVL